MSHVWVKVGQVDELEGGRRCVQVCGDVPLECNNTGEERRIPALAGSE